MSRLVKALLIGALAGIVDVLPMIAMGTTTEAIVSAFLHWVFLGFVITYLVLPVRYWMKGLLVGLAAAVPVVALVSGEDPKALVPIFAFSAVLGAAVGAATGRWATERATGRLDVGSK
jgi:hypothetical protein